MGASSSSRSRKDQKLAPMGRSYGEVRDLVEELAPKGRSCGFHAEERRGQGLLLQQRMAW